MRYFLLFILTAASFGCHQFSNSIDMRQLDCGTDLALDAEYVRSVDSNGNPLKSHQIEAYYLDGNGPQKAEVSSRGCILKPKNSNLLVRNVLTDEVASSSQGDLANLGTLSLKPFQNYPININCDEKVTTVINSENFFNELVIHQLPESYKHAVQVKTTILNDESRRSEFFLTEIPHSQKAIFEKLIDQKTYEIQIEIDNFFKKNSSQIKTCKFKKDIRSANIELTVNSLSDKSTVDWHQTKMTITNDDQSITFRSEDGDIDTVEYCSLQLDDDFSDDNAKRLMDWKSKVVRSDCETWLKVQMGQRFVPGDSGIWVLTYRSLDKAGNRSLTKTETILRKSKSRIDLLKNNSINQIRNLIYENRKSDAMVEALALEQQRRQLPTKYERDATKIDTFSAALAVLNEKNLRLNLEPRSDFREFSQFGPISGSIYGIENRKKITIWDSKSLKIIKQFQSDSLGDIRSFKITPDEKSLIIQFRSEFELWDLSTLKMLRKFTNPENSLIYNLVISPDSKYVLTREAKKLTSFRLDDFSILKSISLAPNSRGYHELAFGKDEHEVYINQEKKELTSFNFLTGEEKPGIKIDSSILITALAYSSHHDLLLIGDNEGTIYIFNSDGTATQLEQSDKNGVRGFRFSPDQKRFLTFSSSGPINTYDLVSRKFLFAINDFKSPTYSSEFAPDGDSILATTLDTTPRLWRLSSSAIIYDKQFENFGPSDVFWKSGSELVIGPSIDSPDDLSLKVNLDRLEEEKIQDAAWYSDLEGRPLAVNSDEWCLRKYSDRQAQPLCHEFITRKFGGINPDTYHFSENLSHGAYYDSKTESIAVVDLLSSLEVSRFVLPANSTLSEIFLNDSGTRLFITTGNKIYATAVSSGKILWEKLVEDEQFSTIRYNQIRNEILVEGKGASLHFFDEFTGLEKGRLNWVTATYPGNSIDRLYLNPESTLLAFSVSDREVMLWDYESKSLITKLNSSDSRLNEGALALRKNALAWVNIEDDNYARIRIWDLEQESLLKKLCRYTQTDKYPDICSDL